MDTNWLTTTNDLAEHAWKRVLAQLPGVAPRPEVIVIDGGNRPDARARQFWRASDRVLLVSTTETAAIMNAYASIKMLN